MGVAARCTFARSERCRRVRMTDAGALVGLVRHKGRVEHKGDGAGQKHGDRPTSLAEGGSTAHVGAIRPSERCRRVRVA